MFELNKKRKTERNEMDGSRDDARMEAASAQTQPPATSRPAMKPASSGAAVIGKAIQIDGDVRGDMDLLIEGEVRGTVHLPNNSVTIGGEGVVHAEVKAKTISVEGAVDGDLFASDRVSVRSSARVSGNIKAPRVSLDDGAHFKGSIEMDVEPVKDRSAAHSSTKTSPAASKANGESPVSGQKSASDEAPRPGA